MVNLLWLTTSLMTCFVIKISLYSVESDAKRVRKEGKRGQNVMRCVTDFPLRLYLIAECRRLRGGSLIGGIKSSFYNVTAGQSMPLNFIKVTI